MFLYFLKNKWISKPYIKWVKKLANRIKRKGESILTNKKIMQKKCKYNQQWNTIIARIKK
jgi:hypothetical protein